MDLCRLYEGLYPLDLYVLGRNAQTTFTALSARVLPRPGGFPPLYSVRLHGAAERIRPHRKPEYPGTRYGCSLAAGVGLEPTGHV